MADEETPYTGPVGVKDLPAETFIQAYATHLKQNDKVGSAGSKLERRWMVCQQGKAP